MNIITFSRDQWGAVDSDRLIEWLVAFCKEAEDIQMVDTTVRKFDPAVNDYVEQWEAVEFRFRDPKTAMAFKLAWGGVI